MPDQIGQTIIEEWIILVVQDIDQDPVLAPVLVPLHVQEGTVDLVPHQGEDTADLDLLMTVTAEAEDIEQFNSSRQSLLFYLKNYKKNIKLNSTNLLTLQQKTTEK